MELRSLLWPVKVRYAGAGVLIFVCSHGVCDGRGVEIALSHVLKLYDGQAISEPKTRLLRSSLQLAQTNGTGDLELDPEKIARWHEMEEEYPTPCAPPTTANAEQEAARRPRSHSVTQKATAEKDKYGGESERGRGRQRMNESGLRGDGGADVLQLQRRSKSLMSKKEYRRSVIVNAVAPAGGAEKNEVRKKRRKK